MPTDTTMEDAVRESLDFDPRISDPSEVAVSVEAGTAILRGTIGTLSQRRAAVSDAREVDGVDDVDDQLEVRLMNADRRQDADIRGVALQILMWDSEVPADVLNVQVDNGWVTLTGEVSYPFQRDAAFGDVADLIGVIGVTDEITVLNS
jgi:osmotically-inducible protein OsmY